jgi:hypothetical protein
MATISWVVISSRRYSPDIQFHRNPPAGCGGQPPLSVDAGPRGEDPSPVRHVTGLTVRPAEKGGGSRPV